ncbi:methyltransferase domain-containing protein [Candidatus Gottesmanbacteria bacterium]|nr:methyltransferase domain-containing protein [Candidatus Gottesmanbacteria bacterium]
MSSWLFIFGRTHELSFYELAALIHDPVTTITPGVGRVEDPQETIDPGVLIRALGGTVKIAREKGKIAVLTAEEVLLIFKNEGESLTFGISLYGEGHLDTRLLAGVKEGLERRGIHARYVAGHEGNALSSVVITKQHVKELILVRVKDGYIVGETEAVQDFEAWNARDYGRPYADPKAGMLPPKVARMAINLASASTHSRINASRILLDPFCGMGTILGEALLTGWSVIGSDQSEEAVEKAKKNIEFLQGTSLQDRKEVPYGLFVSDATHISEKIAPESIDAIVTEPFMGPTVVETENVKNVIKGLEKLYIGCLREWHKILKPKGHIVIALPEYAVGGKTFFVKTIIDRCENLGYTVTLGPLEYSRPQAVVRRKFFVLWRT